MHMNRLGLFILYDLQLGSLSRNRTRGCTSEARSNSIQGALRESSGHIDMAPPCVAWTSVPTNGVYRASGRSTTPTTFTGDWRGQLEYAFALLILPSGLSYNSEVNYFTGTIRGCGTGSMLFQDQIISETKGRLRGWWQIVEGGWVFEALARVKESFGRICPVPETIAEYFIAGSKELRPRYQVKRLYCCCSLGSCAAAK